jgi:hypothetical protein
MKSILLLLLGILFLHNVYSQENDSIYIFGCEDNWENIEVFRNIIVLKIDSIISNDNIFKIYSNQKKILCFTIDELGNVKNIYFKENNGFGKMLDNIIYKSLNNMKFKDAAVYNTCTQKRYLINFAIPINLSENENRNKK